jgi:hypothetical protein
MRSSIRELAQTNPGKDAVVVGNVRLSYGELPGRAAPALDPGLRRGNQATNEAMINHRLGIGNNPKRATNP